MISMDFENRYRCVRMLICDYKNRNQLSLPSLQHVIISVIQVTEDEKVSTVKELIFARLNIPANQQRLLYKGKALAGSFLAVRYACQQVCLQMKY